MAKLEGIDAPGILGITDQQLNLLKTIYKLNTKNKAATPREIEAAYAKDQGGGIQKSNLFRQMKILQDKGFLTREGEANYKINFDGLKKTLDQRKQEYTQTLQHYEQLTNETEEYFRKTTANPEKPVVEYLDYSSLFASISKSLSTAQRYLATGKFPNIFYKREVAAAIGRGEFWDVLHKIFFDKRFELVYLTRLDLDSPYHHALKFYGDHQKAYDETERILNDVLDYTERFANLKIMYLREPYGLDILIPEKKNTDSYYQFIRDEKMNILGGIYIQSQETARNAKETYMNILNSATQVKGPQGEAIIDSLRSILKAKYGTQKDGLNRAGKGDFPRP